MAFRFIAALAFGFFASAPLLAQTEPNSTYPERNPRIIVGFPAGTTTDAIARVVAEHLGRRLGKQLHVENKPGASGNLSAGVVAQSEPDGHTLYLAAVGLASTVAVNPGAVQVDPVEGLAHVGLISYSTNVLITGTDSGISTVKDIAARATGEKTLTFGSSGIGGGLHLTGEMFKFLTKTNLVHVPYRGSALALTDLLSGRLDLQFDNVAGALPMIREGKVRAIAVTSQRRIRDLPDVPTLAELGIEGLEAGAWFSLMAPLGTPAPILERLARELREAQNVAAFKQFFERLGMEVLQSRNPEESKAYIAADVARWRRLVSATGVKVDAN